VVIIAPWQVLHISYEPLLLSGSWLGLRSYEDSWFPACDHVSAGC
jgi:hypothetical protein